MMAISRGFGGRRRDDVDPSRLPPGHYYERGCPSPVGRTDAAPSFSNTQLAINRYAIRWTDATRPPDARSAPAQHAVRRRGSHSRPVDGARRHSRGLPHRRALEAEHSLTAREKQSRALLLSSFFWTLGEANRIRLRRKMLELLDQHDSLADRRLILRAIDETWPATARPPAAQRVADFYLERPDIANRPGAYGI